MSEQALEQLIDIVHGLCFIFAPSQFGVTPKTREEHDACGVCRLFFYAASASIPVLMHLSHRHTMAWQTQVLAAGACQGCKIQIMSVL